MANAARMEATTNPACVMATTVCPANRVTSQHEPHRHPPLPCLAISYPSRKCLQTLRATCALFPDRCPMVDARELPRSAFVRQVSSHNGSGPGIEQRQITQRPCRLCVAMVPAPLKKRAYASLQHE